MSKLKVTYAIADGSKIKDKAAYYINRFYSRKMAVPRAKDCALILVEELQMQFEKIYRGSGDKDSDDAEYGAKMRVFDELIKAIKAF